MARLFPLRSETPSREGRPRVVDLADEDADAVFSALSSTTARRIYARLDDEPGTPSDVADSIDSSIQNVRYHLEKLEDAGLVEVVDTWYSSRGNEMSVYATADGPLIVTSDESRAAQLKEALSRFVGGVAALAGASGLVQLAAEGRLTPTFGTSEDSGAGDRAPPDGDGAGGPDDEVAEDAPTDEDAPPETDREDEGLETAETDDREDAADADDTADARDDAGGAESEPPSDNETATSTDNETVAPTENETATPTEPDTVAPTGNGTAEATEAVLSTLPPGLLFFLGGLVVLTAVLIYWYWRHR